MCLYRHPARIFFAFIAIAFFSGAFHPPCIAAEKTRVITVMGGSRIYTDIPSAKAAAVGRCLMSAVETAAIGLLPLERLAENFEGVSGMLKTRRNEFIQDYKILKEVRTETDYRVLVQVTVSIESLEKGLSAAGVGLAPGEMPRVLLLVAEKDADDILFQYWWRKGKPLFISDSAIRPMKRILEGKGFPLIDPEEIPAGFFKDLDLDPFLTNQDAVLLGKRLNADVVIAGKAVAEETANRLGENIRSIRGTVDIRAILIETGEQIAAVRKSATAAESDMTIGSRQALSAAGQQAGMKLADRVLSEWEALKAPAGEIRINIRGTDLLPHLVVFRNTLRAMPGVSAQRTLEMTPDTAVLAIRYEGTPQALADALLLKTFTGFGLNIYEISGDSVNIELVPQ